MKVTFAIVNYAPSVGGAQTYAQRVAEGLVARSGCEVEVLTTDALRQPAARDPGRIECREERIGGVLVRRYPIARRLQLTLRTGRRIAHRLGLPRPKPTAMLALGPLPVRFTAAVGRAGRESSAVVGWSPGFLGLVGAGLATGRSRALQVAVPFLHLDAGDPSSRLMRVLAGADRCVAMTTYERAWMIDAGMAPSKVDVIAPGCSAESFLELDPEAARATLGLPDRPTVGYIGRLTAQKGIDTFLDAVPRLLAARPDCSVLLAGSHTGWEDLDTRLASFDAATRSRVVVREAFSEAEKGVLFAACDVVVLPSREESFGLAILEAWSARRPIVASDLGSVRCVVRDGRDGDLVPVDDSGALAAAIGGLLTDRGRARRYGIEGRRRVDSEFSWEGVIDHWDALLRDATRTGSPSPSGRC